MTAEIRCYFCWLPVHRGILCSEAIWRWLKDPDGH